MDRFLFLSPREIVYPPFMTSSKIIRVKVGVSSSSCIFISFSLSIMRLGEKLVLLYC